MSSSERETLYQQQEWDVRRSLGSTPGDVGLINNNLLETPTTPLPPNTPDTTTTEVGSIQTDAPPPAYSALPPRTPTAPSISAPPPSYDECHNPNAPPPSYESLFGRVREVQKSSTGLLDYVKKLLLLLLGTVGCTIVISITIVIPIFMIIIGSLKMDECPVERFIPIYLVVGGTFGVLKNLLSFSRSLRCPLGEEDGVEEEGANVPWHRRIQFTSSISFFLTGWFITGCIWVYRVYEPNYTDRESNRYCDYVLYQFAFWLVTLVYICVGLLTSCMCCLSATNVFLQRNRMIAAQV